MEAISEAYLGVASSAKPIRVGLKPVRTKLELVKPDLIRTNFLARREILVVEDDFYSAKIYKLMLAKLGYQCDHASSGAEALQFLKGKTYKIILLDINLPDCSGRELISKIRILSEDSEAKIIASTAYGSPLAKNGFLQDGFDDYFPKPFTKESLSLFLEPMMA